MTFLPEKNYALPECVNVKIAMQTPGRVLVDGLIDNDEKIASFKKHTLFNTRVQKPYPSYYQNGKTD